jgi:putative MFS transporter
VLPRSVPADLGLVDGLGVMGGMIGVLVIAPLVKNLTTLPARLLISSFLVAAAILAQFAPRTRNRALKRTRPERTSHPARRRSLPTSVCQQV